MTPKELQPWHTFVLLLLVQWIFFGDCLIVALFKSYVLYLIVGGWKFQRLFFLTIRRDLKGLRCLGMILYHTYHQHFTKENFAEIFQRTVKKHGRLSTAIYHEDQVWTLGDLDAYSNKVANHLISCGLKRGDVIFMLMQPSAAYLGIWLGAVKAGIIPGLLNYNLRNASLTRCLDELDAKAIVVGNRLKDAFVEIDGEAKYSNGMFWYVDEDSSRPESAFSNEASSTGTWNQVIAKSSWAPPPKLSRMNGRERIAYLYTSGTTGFPKAAIITTPRFIYMTSGTRYGFGIRASDIIYISVPLHHTLGLICGVGQLMLHGTCLAIRSKFSASQFWDDCIKYNCTVVQYIGELCRFLLAQPPKPTDTMHRVRLAYGNGLRKETWIQFQNRFKVPEIGELFGATESNTSIVNCDQTVGAIGFIPLCMRSSYPIYIIKMNETADEPIRDPATGLCIECGPNEVGQIVGRINENNPSRSYDGYLNRDESEKKVLRDVFKKGDQWFASGDLLYYDELGYLFFSDRVGDTFRWHGENVSTSEVEAVLMKEFPDTGINVYGVLVPGTEGRAGMAAFEVDIKSMTTEQEQLMVAKIYSSTEKALPPYARPQFLRFCADFEMTNTFKLLKRGLMKSGFDPTNTKDHLYILDKQSKCYVPLTESIYQDVLSGAIRM
ncbi:AMP-binding enzyme [Opisthorchis viverrini]|uniref:Long-chain-fatty-acid--CoA ligase n=1 Tax=Opisthorchis viverrini TaxID=6198 RepID=A0A1S8WI32_OPIVI|nr:AMP-binding enzyme [Opisthorchis viverrini]